MFCKVARYGASQVQHERWSGKLDVEEMIRMRDAQSPMGHMGDAWDVAHAALFLASDEAKYITGAELIVDGGLTLSSVSTS